jgi:hypothetical protein
MTVYDDLTALPADGTGVTMLAIGWLGKGSSYSRGVFPQVFIEKLLALAENPQKLTRGLHYCEFCDMESPIELKSSVFSQGRAWIGNGEIHVSAGPGRLFVMPTLAIHYISHHQYLPPLEFLRALERTSS